MILVHIHCIVNRLYCIESQVRIFGQELGLLTYCEMVHVLLALLFII